MISQKRVQKYQLISIPPNFSRRKLHFSFKFNTHKHFSRFKSVFLLIIYIRAKERLCSSTRKRRCIPGFSTKCIENYFQKYSSLFTKQAGTPINTGGVGGEEWWCTLHHSSPLFIQTILEKKNIRQANVPPSMMTKP